MNDVSNDPADGVLIVTFKKNDAGKKFSIRSHDRLNNNKPLSVDDIADAYIAITGVLMNTLENFEEFQKTMMAELPKPTIISNTNNRTIQ